MTKNKKLIVNKLCCYLLVVIQSLVFASLSFSADKVYYYHTDHVGTPMSMTDSSGTTVWEADYLPFGEESEITASKENKQRFVGKEKDEETDLYYFGARYLDARIGRFTKPDPVGINESDLLNPQKFNRYNYSLNNPYRYVDPDGNTPWDIVDFGFFAHSAYQFAKKPSWSTGGDLALDTVGLLPLVPSLGTIKVVGKGYSKLLSAPKFYDWKPGTDIVSTVLKEDTKMYRISGGSAEKAGKFLTPVKPQNTHDARRLLNLPDGNTGKYIGEVTVSAGTRVQSGTAYGGGKQVKLLQDIPDKSFGPRKIFK